MGTTKTWRGPRFTGVGSSHDLGGCRMGEDPAGSVVNRSSACTTRPGSTFQRRRFSHLPGHQPHAPDVGPLLPRRRAAGGRLGSGEER
jgi:gluconate 2-dehydrogenase alpha chain